MHQIYVFDHPINLVAAELNNSHIMKFLQFLLHPHNNDLVNFNLFLVFQQQSVLVLTVKRLFYLLLCVFASLLTIYVQDGVCDVEKFVDW